MVDGLAPDAVQWIPRLYCSVRVLMLSGTPRFIRLHTIPGPILWTPEIRYLPRVIRCAVAHKTSNIPIIIATDGTSGISEQVSSNQKVHQGLVFFIKVVIPDYDNVVTATLDIIDKDGDTIYTIAGLTKGVTNIISDIQVPLVAQETIKLTLTGVPGGLSAWTSYVTLYYLSDYI